MEPQYSVYHSYINLILQLERLGGGRRGIWVLVNMITIIDTFFPTANLCILSIRFLTIIITVPQYWMGMGRNP